MLTTPAFYLGHRHERDRSSRPVLETNVPKLSTVPLSSPSCAAETSLACQWMNPRPCSGKSVIKYWILAGVCVQLHSGIMRPQLNVSVMWEAEDSPRCSSCDSERWNPDRRAGRRWRAAETQPAAAPRPRRRLHPGAGGRRDELGGVTDVTLQTVWYLRIWWSEHHLSPKHQTTAASQTASPINICSIVIWFNSTDVYIIVSTPTKRTSLILHTNTKCHGSSINSQILCFLVFESCQ